MKYIKVPILNEEFRELELVERSKYKHIYLWMSKNYDIDLGHKIGDATIVETNNEKQEEILTNMYVSRRSSWIR